MDTSRNQTNDAALGAKMNSDFAGEQTKEDNNSGLGQQMKDKAEHASHVAKENMTEAGNTVKEKVNEASHTAQETAQKAKDRLKEMMD